ncbi:MAG: polysaccharide deacetylase family protein [Lachnospiraceae bacterium]|nr:polysaccharide deacetylase family protein [Lachnospiraceae bacterium]
MKNYKSGSLWVRLAQILFFGVVTAWIMIGSHQGDTGEADNLKNRIEMAYTSAEAAEDDTDSVADYDADNDAENDAEGDIEIAFTFDDGPHPVWTQKLLDGLKKRGIRATFFVIGKSAEEHPELIKQMLEDGNQVGNHTYSHIQLTACSRNSALEEIQRTQDIIYRAAGFCPEYIRPPFGSWNDTLQEETSLETVLWDVDPYDWKVQDTDAIVRSILKQTKDGSIILLHDVYETSVDAALKVADIFLERGYRFCTVEEIMIE